jgi:SAM-dependent methyltransferase
MTVTTGSATRWGPIWGARAHDWARSEEQQLPTYEAAIEKVGIGSGTRVLEVGCGTGVFLRAAADRGANVTGLDASTELIALAWQRVPEADLHVGEMEALPFADDSFDVVAGFNAFFFADDMVAALREAGRVARPGASVVVQVWGNPEHCDLDPLKHALGQFLPPRPPSGPGLWEAGVLEGIVEEAGLSPVETFDISWPFRYTDEDELARDLLAPALSVLAVEQVGEEAVRAAIVESLEPYRSDSGYELENEWHFVIASA